MNAAVAYVTSAAAAAAGVAAGRAFQQRHRWGTRYWQAQCFLTLALHDEAQLIQIQALMPKREPSELLDRVLSLSARLAEPRRSTRHT